MLVIRSAVPRRWTALRLRETNMPQPFQYSPAIWPQMAVALISAVFAAFVWPRRSVAGATPYFIAMVVYACASLLMALMIAATSLSLKLAFRQAWVLCILVGVWATLALALDYRGYTAQDAGLELGSDHCPPGGYRRHRHLRTMANPLLDAHVDRRLAAHGRGSRQDTLPGLRLSPRPWSPSGCSRPHLCAPVASSAGRPAS